jgi:ubiquinone biosynthesis monooxygenase Coq7
MKPPYSFIDKLCLGADQILRALSSTSKTSGRPYPVARAKEVDLSESERKRSAALMRINHAGEICAQALYQGQALTSRSPQTQDQLQQAAIEEGDHLSWCATRLEELGSHPSRLSPLWYGGSLVMGIGAGLLGDKWSLGFLAETEKQVVEHLAGHLKDLPAADTKSYQIVKQMHQDEAQHQAEALALGGVSLPRPVRQAMRFISRLMVKTAYWL